MKTKFIYSILMAGGLLTATSCKDYLDYEPKGLLSSENTKSASSAEALATAAYAGIGNDEMIGPMTSMWVYGSVRSDDAYKGGGGVSDVAEIDFYEHYNLTRPDLGSMHPFTWENFYKAISRANAALVSLNALTEAEFPLKQTRIAEMRFLRGHSHFMLKMLFKNIPYITENLTSEDVLKTSNVEFTNDQLWNKIGEDFQFAIDNLPAKQTQVGRANKLSAAAYLAKLRLYQAYEQDETHKVTGINKTRLQEVVTLTQQVIASGQYSLQPDFAENFIAETENGPESIFAIQYSINDGTAVGRLSYVTGLNYPHGAPQYGCCGFHQPSQSLANAYKTGADGLPLFDTYNDKNVDFATETVDTRVDHTIGIDGHVYKYDATKPFSNSWIRDPGVYGSFHTMKEQQLATSASYHKEGPFIGSSKNIDVLRYDDVLLMQAEAYIELGQQAMALPLINQIRKRAANSTGRLKKKDGTFASKYNVKEYAATGWTQDYARKALQWERRLEFATESPRFFDLVRWGIAEKTLNAYLEKEKVRRPFLATAKFTAGRDEYLPIPQREISFTKGLYKQNPGF
ncbi:RagB/SusD family nutrient uptake outer membrane protein [Dyadobacter chenwenxiniae]|uniref:RagB/SusD family nutrient uptake outer membrane protein n=1 Tax=Dyadobacter chenwenxiniae TaxID=2906456 RepID=A0A9X1PT45_9BACT|nr:RagB/SusD family nutrient uptake outer membrane protein [Dyadobacter chenwenxiniae]MCF0064671.1 RagB/SusD family nutrient uptake outer membrane protein [Dyadobacter chenwenxiniae]UON84275.1 RagB/SusD family nutrient uptake outer membrane protein [Dyadobacter chenwenxiniae]